MHFLDLSDCMFLSCTYAFQSDGQGTPCSKQARNLKVNTANSNPQPLSSYTFWPKIELCCEYLSVLHLTVCFYHVTYQSAL